MARSARASTSRHADSLGDQITEIARNAGEQIQLLSEDMLDTIQQRPFTALATAFGSGFIFEQLLRRSRR